MKQRHMRPKGKARNDAQAWEGYKSAPATTEGLAQYQYGERKQSPPSSNAEPTGSMARKLGSDFIPIEPGRSIYQASERNRYRIYKRIKKNQKEKQAKA